MNRKKLSAALCLITAMIMLLSACSLKKPVKKDSEYDPTVTVMKLGEETVSLAVFRSLYDNYLPYMQHSGLDPLEDKTSLESFQDWLVDILSDDLVTRHQAKLSGFELTEEQENELNKEIESGTQSIYDELMKYAEQDYEDDPSIPLNVYFDSLVNNESEYHTGTAMGWEDYKAFYAQETRTAYTVVAYRDHVCSEFRPTEDYIRNWYDAAHENDKANYTDSPEKYKTDEENYELAEGDGLTFPVTFVPAGYSRIMHIIVSPQGELSDEHKEALARMEELRSEFSELAFEDALNGGNSHSAEIQKILDDYRELKEQTDEQYEQFVSEARSKIEAAFSELTAGRDFADVMLRYTEDAQITGDENKPGCEAFRTKGQLISLRYDCENDWSKAVKDEFAKLKPGEFSKPFMDDGSFHLICYASDEPSGDVALEDIYDQIEAVCTESVKDSQWEALLEEWKRDPELEIELEIIRTIGLKDLDKEEE